MLNVLADQATQGETVLAVWVWGPGKVGNVFSEIIGGLSGPPVDSATAIATVEDAVNGATGLQGTEPAAAYQGPAAVYVGMSMVVTSDGDGVPYNQLLAPIAQLGGIFSPGSGAILAFVDYGSPGESSIQLASRAASKDDTGKFAGALTPTAAITGIQDAIDSLGAETPYFQGYWGVKNGAAVGASGGAASGGFSSQINTTTTSNNAVIGPSAATAQAGAQGIKDIAAGASIGIVGIIIALLVAEAFLAKSA